jgi:hypothetical protein
MLWLLLPALLHIAVPDRLQELKNPALRQELLQMMKVDQDARMKLLELMKKRSLENHKDVGTALNSKEFEEANKIDAQNKKRMKEIIDQHGWPGASLVGKDGANAAWLLVQHADTDRAFQQKCLDLMKAAPASEVEKKNIAYLTDRVLVGQKKKQVYGTQLDNKCEPQPIEDPDNVDKRRAEMGLGTMAEYLKFARQMYGIKEKEKEKDKK